MFVGIDVSKDTLDVASRPDEPVLRYSNDEPGIAKLSQLFAEKKPTLVVVEASGGFEMAVVAALALAGVPVAVVNPRQVRDFARATGTLAKTDGMDAGVLARFAEAVRPVPRPVPDDDSRALAALAARRRQLVEMLVAERTRRPMLHRSQWKSIDRHIPFLEKELSRADHDLGNSIERSPLWKVKDDLSPKHPRRGKGDIASP